MQVGQTTVFVVVRWKRWHDNLMTTEPTIYTHVTNSLYACITLKVNHFTHLHIPSVQLVVQWILFSAALLLMAETSLQLQSPYPVKYQHFQFLSRCLNSL